MESFNINEQKKKVNQMNSEMMSILYVKENRLSAPNGSTSKSRKGNKFKMTDDLVKKHIEF